MFNVGNDEHLSLRVIADLIVAAAGSGTVETVPWPPDREKIDIGSIYVDDARLRALTGWSPKVGLREGLERTFAFYREHGVHYWA